MYINDNYLFCKNIYVKNVSNFFPRFTNIMKVKNLIRDTIENKNI